MRSEEEEGGRDGGAVYGGLAALGTRGRAWSGVNDIYRTPVVDIKSQICR